MAFPEGVIKTGLTRDVSLLLAELPPKKTLVTVPDIERLCRKHKIPFKNRKVIGNLMMRLLKNDIVRGTEKYDGRFKRYRINPELKPQPKPKPNLSYTAALEEDLNQAKQKNKELEDQLLVEMENVEGLEARVKELKKGHEIDYYTLGKSVVMAQQKLQTAYNQLEAEHRDKLDKHKKIHSEDRSTIGSLQKKVRSLEAENRSLRAKLSTHSNNKVDMSIFNPPRMKGTQ